MADQGAGAPPVEEMSESGGTVVEYPWDPPGTELHEVPREATVCPTADLYCALGGETVLYPEHVGGK